MGNDNTGGKHGGGLLWVAVIMLGLVGFAAAPEPSSQYSAGHFGDDNLPAGCILEMSRDNPDNHCFHAKAGLNGLDSPQVDVAIVVPASPTAERDMRIVRQAIESWEGGLDVLAERMGLDWLADGLDFHVSLDVIDPTGDSGGEFTTYPLYDPEIVVIASNPAGGIGIGIDPVDFSGQILEIFGAPDSDEAPCHGVANPFDMDAWEAVPGFDSHHDQRGGTYVEDCGGAGGNVCFAVNGAIDPVPGQTDLFSLYDLVMHEVGHCLTLGHVGDGAEGDWGPVPTTDIMAYSYDPPGMNKCVSTLNVEAFALQMSKYLDVNGDGEVSEDDLLVPNDLTGDGLNSFQVQHPDDYFHASSTGSAWDCPQPDLELVPGDRTDWMPAATVGIERILDVTSPSDGERSAAGTFRVTGSVLETPPGGMPTATSATATDPTGDSWTPYGDIEQLDVEATATHVVATLKVSDVLPATGPASVVAYSVTVGFQQIDSFVDLQDPGVVHTYDHSMEVPLPGDWSEWDVDAGTVTLRIPRSFLAAAQEYAPYGVTAWTNMEANYKFHVLTDDRAPDEGRLLIAAPAIEAVEYELPPNDGVDPLDLLLGAGGGGEEGPPDADRDGVIDEDDACPADAGAPPDGCPVERIERVNVHLDGTFVGSTDVVTPPGPEVFAMDIKADPGVHEVTIEWEKRGRVIASATREVIVPAATNAAPAAPGTDGNGANGAPQAQAQKPLPTTGGGHGIAVVLVMLGLAMIGGKRRRSSEWA